MRIRMRYLVVFLLLCGAFFFSFQHDSSVSPVRYQPHLGSQSTQTEEGRHSTAGLCQVRTEQQETNPGEFTVIKGQTGD